MLSIHLLNVSKTFSNYYINKSICGIKTKNFKTIKNYSKFLTQENIYNLNVSSQILCKNKQTRALLYNNPAKLIFNYNLLRCNSLYTTNEVLKENHDKHLEAIHKKYPNPKTILYNYYTVVSNELKENYQPITNYKFIPRKSDTKREHGWVCTMTVKWPEEYKVTVTSQSKTDSSVKAAFKILCFLDSAGKIVNNGQPVIYDREEFDRITKKTYLPIVLDPEVENMLKEIRNIYDKKLKNLTENFRNAQTGVLEESTMESDDYSTWAVGENQQDMRVYFAKESVHLPIQEHR